MMRKVLNTVNMDGVIVIGEGEKDEVSIHAVADKCVVQVCISAC